MRDAVERPPVLAGSIGKSSYHDDCDSYPPRPAMRVPSDRFFSVELFGAATPVTALQRMANPADVELDGEDADGHRAHVEVVGVSVMIPMPANISLHGRREGVRGAWATQDRFVNDSIGHWTDLGVLAADCILVMKALQVFVKERMASFSTQAGPSERYSGSVTEMPAGMPDVDLQLSRLEVMLMDDSFEVWMGAFQRLHLDEVVERLKREEMLRHKIQILRGSGGVQVSDETEERMWQELSRQNARAWLTRVSKFKQSDFFQAPPPLMSLHLDALTGLFLPRQAPWLERKIAELDLSGLSEASALWPEFDMMVGGEMSEVKATGVSLRPRRSLLHAPAPLLRRSSLPEPAPLPAPAPLLPARLLRSDLI